MLVEFTTERIATFMSRVQFKDGHWLWTGCRNGKGYGAYAGNGAHRVTYEWFIGDIPQGLEIDHLCRVRACVNPLHLEAVTGRVNRLRANRFQNEGVCWKRGHVLASVGTERCGRESERTCSECRRLTRAMYLVRHGKYLPPFAVAALTRELQRLVGKAAWS